jgi:4-amino-4-deoxy-L-arabinose transferase-like glycosyltransferase
VTTVSRQAALPTKPYELWLIAFLAMLLPLRLIANAFAVTDLVFNEAQYWSWSRELDLGYFSKPPLLAWLIRTTSELCGQGEACLRSFPPVLFTLATWFVFLTGRALYGRQTGFWSASIFATLPLTAFGRHRPDDGPAPAGQRCGSPVYASFFCTDPYRL